MKKIFAVAMLWLIFQNSLIAQQAPPFWSDIVAFKKKDSTQTLPVHPILLVGSSSFTKWTDVNSYFPDYVMLNRGFGGSTLPDLIRYVYDIILPYKPRQVLIYCGENDLAAADSISAKEVIQRVKTLFWMIRTNLPDAAIAYVSIKPSPVRVGIQGKVKEANKGIKEFLKGQKNTAFINIYDAMLDAKKQMREELYVGDRLHMKSEGYAIWKTIIQPYLIK